MDKILYSILIMNVITFCIYAYDKFSAINNRWRVSEKNLFLLAFFFGGIGATLAMKIFHHKTQKPLFLLVIPILTALQIVAIATLYGIKLK